METDPGRPDRVSASVDAYANDVTRKSTEPLKKWASPGRPVGRRPHDDRDGGRRVEDDPEHADRRMPGHEVVLDQAPGIRVATPVGGHRIARVLEPGQAADEHRGDDRADERAGPALPELPV